MALKKRDYQEKKNQDGNAELGLERGIGVEEEKKNERTIRKI